MVSRSKKSDTYFLKKTTYAMKTPHVVAIPFMYSVKYVIIYNQKRATMTVILSVWKSLCVRLSTASPRSLQVSA